jgi:hypothetical protein
MQFTVIQPFVSFMALATKLLLAGCAGGSCFWAADLVKGCA